MATASSAGLVADMGFVHYSMAKIAVTHMVRVAARELGPFGIRVNAVAPGPTRTAMMAGTDDIPGFAEAVEANTPLGGIGDGRGHRGDRARAVRPPLGHRPDRSPPTAGSPSRPAPTCPASPPRPSPSGDLHPPPPRCAENGCPVPISRTTRKRDGAALMRAVRVVDGAPAVVQVDEPDAGRVGTAS